MKDLLSVVCSRCLKNLKFGNFTLPFGRLRQGILRAAYVIRTSNMKFSSRRLADYVEPVHQKACRTCSTIAPKCVPHVQHGYFSSFNQSYHWSVALWSPLLSSTQHKKRAARAARLHQNACRTRSTIIFPCSTNHIIDSWRCGCRCCRHFKFAILQAWVARSKLSYNQS